jgi:hypothetical protein
MVTTGLSEFTFGFGFLHEQIVRLRQEVLEDGTRLTGAPVFPSPQFEAERGYDVFLPTSGGDYYFQFKASDYYSHPLSEWLADGTYTDPYYRIKLHKRDNNKQHRILRALSGKKECPYKEHTYYVAPEIDSLASYNTAFLAGNITENSRKIPLIECDDILNASQHHITFQKGEEGWKQHSFSIHHDHSILGKQIIPEYVKHKSEWKKIDDQYATVLFSTILDRAKQVETTKEIETILEKFSINFERFERSVVDEKFVLSVKVKTLIKTSFILSHVFGATLFFVGSQGNFQNQNQ